MIKFKSRSEERIRRTKSRNQRAADERVEVKNDRDANTARLRELRLANAAAGDGEKQRPEIDHQDNGKATPIETTEEKEIILPVPHRR